MHNIRIKSHLSLHIYWYIWNKISFCFRKQYECNTSFSEYLFVCLLCIFIALYYWYDNNDLKLSLSCCALSCIYRQLKIRPFCYLNKVGFKATCSITKVKTCKLLLTEIPFRLLLRQDKQCQCRHSFFNPLFIIFKKHKSLLFI